MFGSTKTSPAEAGNQSYQLAAMRLSRSRIAFRPSRASISGKRSSSAFTTHLRRSARTRPAAATARRPPPCRHGRHRRAAVVGDDADQVGGVENALTPAAALVVTGDLHPGVEDAHHASRHLDPHPGADQPPGHAVVVGVEIDRAVRLHTPDHLAHLPERRPAMRAPVPRPPPAGTARSAARRWCHGCADRQPRASIGQGALPAPPKRRTCGRRSHSS